MCVPFLRGNCTRGSNCKLAHDERYKAQALKRLEQRPARKGRGRGRGGRGRGGRYKGRSAGAVEGEADGEEEADEADVDYIEVDMDLPAEPEEGDHK